MSATIGTWQYVGSDRYELGEGARSYGDGFVFVDLLAGCLYSVTGCPGCAPTLLTQLDVPLGAASPDDDGGWLVAAGTGFASVEPDGRVHWIANPVADGPMPMRMNDGAADPRGTFWAGAMPYDDTRGAGVLFRLDEQGSPQVVADGLSVPNGPAFDASGSVMYVADSPLGTIYRYEVDARVGELRRRDVFATVTSGSPDGMTVDADGCLWAAIWGGSCLHRYAADGTLLEIVDVPAVQPTSIALTTTEPYRALVTSATLGRERLSDGDGRVLTARASVGGLATQVATRPVPEPPA